jgi:hypothetical protein
MRFTFILFVAAVCFSCTKKETTSPIDIAIKLNDDVSPVKVEFSIPGEYDFIEWTLEGNTSITDYYVNPTTCVYDRIGPANIKVFAYNNSTGKRVSGSTQINIPGIAKQYKISGFVVDNNLSSILNQKQLSVTMKYLKFGDLMVKSFSIPAKTLNSNDTLLLDEPIIYDIDGFMSGSHLENDIFITLNSNTDNRLLYSSSFNLTGTYLSQHALNPNSVTLFSISPNNNYRISLLCDWMPN